MSFFEDFIKESKEKKISESSVEEIKEMLCKRKLDDFTLDLIANKLGIDQTQTMISGFEIVGYKSNNFSDKQNHLRILAGQFLIGDVLSDRMNYMQYTYMENRGSKENGFAGKVNLEQMANSGLTSFTIDIPEMLNVARINSLEKAFEHTKDYSITVNIQATNVLINGMFRDSGVINIPDFNRMKPEMIETWFSDTELFGKNAIYDVCLSADVRELYNGLISIPEMNPETLMQFMIENRKKAGEYMLDDSNNEKLAYMIAVKYFGMKAEQLNISAEQKSEIEHIVSLYKDTSSTKDVLSQLAQNITKEKRDLTDFDRHTTEQLLKRLNLQTKENVIAMYLASLSQNEFTLSSADIITSEGSAAQIYKFETKDGITAYYNPIKDVVECRDGNSYSAERLNNAYESFVFTEVSPEIKQQIMSEFSIKYSEVANDVLENDTTSVPTSSIEDKGKEDR